MNHTVLLTDDDPSILHGLTRALHRQPYELLTATSGTEAMLVLKSHQVDVVVADEHMPGMRGGDLLAWVAEHFPDVVRLVLTGYPTVETAIRAINEGRVYQFFTKPCNPAHLGVAIRKALEHKDLLRENRRLADLAGHQTGQLDHCRADLAALASILARDVRAPLESISGSCWQPRQPRQDVSESDHQQLAEHALGAVAELQQLVGTLSDHCWEKTPATDSNGCRADQPETAPVACRSAGNRQPA